LQLILGLIKLLILINGDNEELMKKPK
jgi:hypothetical protein